MQLWHLTFSTDKRFVLFTDEIKRRRALRRIIGMASAELILYCLVDDHLHLVVLCTGKRAATLLRAIQLALRPHLAGRIDVDRRSVAGRSHLEWLLRYHLNQVDKHGLKVHPALWSGSCFQELAGARCLVDLCSRLDEVLPRLARYAAHEMIGLPGRDIAPMGLVQVRAAGVVRVAQAAGISLLARPGMKGQGTVEMLAKRTVAQLVVEAGIPPLELAWLFKQDASTIRRWRRPAVAPELLRAVRVRLALEDLVASLSMTAQAAALEGAQGQRG